MSVQVMSWVFAHAPKDLRPAEMLVAIALANHASSDGGHAYPSVQTIMDETRLTRRSVQGALRSLEERGVIAVEREATRRLPAMYGFVAFRGAEFAPHMEEGAQTVQSGAQSTHVRGANSAPKPSEEPSEEPLVTPLSPPTGGSAPKDKRATRLKDDWEPTTEMVDWACVNVPCSMFDCKRETEKFMDHFIGNGKRMVDWERAWKNWMRRSREFAPRGNGHAEDAKAFAAWDTVLRALEYKREHGAMPAERPDDDALHKAVAALGGWGALSGDRFDRAHFVTAYREFKGAT